jgi:hypothetical protein
VALRRLRPVPQERTVTATKPETQATTWSSRANKIIARAEADGTLDRVEQSQEYGMEQISILVKTPGVSFYRVVHVVFTRWAGSGRAGKMGATTWSAHGGKSKTIRTYRDVYAWMMITKERAR